MSPEPNTRPWTLPGDANAEQGHVVLDGPDGAAVTMTAEAAIATGRRLVEAGEQALLHQPAAS